MGCACRGRRCWHDRRLGPGLTRLDGSCECSMWASEKSTTSRSMPTAPCLSRPASEASAWGNGLLSRWDACLSLFVHRKTSSFKLPGIRPGACLRSPDSIRSFRLWDRRCGCAASSAKSAANRGTCYASLTLRADGSSRLREAGGNNRAAPWWSMLRRGYGIHELEAHANEIGALAFLTEDVLITGSCDKSVVVHSLSIRRQPIAAESLQSPVQALQLQP